MCADISRRDLLKAAGGLTFLALIPAARGRFVLEPWSLAPARPVFTALPYVQPGDNSRLVPGQERTVLAWQTDATAADFTVVYGPSRSYGHTARVSATHRHGGGEDAEPRLNYAAEFTGLALGAACQYRVSLGDHVIAEGYFTTRKPRGVPARFVSFGDNSFGDTSERAIAYYAYQARPDFVMNTGDNVYQSGLDHEYARYFFPVYNADVAGPRVGAPLLRSIPFYTVIANHDVAGTTAERHPVADFDTHADSLGYFTNMHLPLNAPVHPQPTPIVGAPPRLDAFRASAGARYPRMANYSFDYGDGHFLCLDSNLYLDPTDAGWQRWIADDLAATDAAWKFVVYHHPAFNVGLEHYTEQHMRVLSPIFERHGVTIVLSGHEHNYQRTRPIRFAPADPGAAARLNQSDRLVPGTFTVDTAFDGRRVRRPDGVIYLTTGAGGNKLYDPDFTNTPSRWLRPEDGNVAYVERLVADRHSLTVIDMQPHQLLVRQVDERGRELDRIRIDS
jgi:calcineurin-like phosphoesterase family protein